MSSKRNLANNLELSEQKDFIFRCLYNGRKAQKCYSKFNFLKNLQDNFFLNCESTVLSYF